MNHSPLRLIVLVAVCMAGIQSCSASPTVPDFFSVQSTEDQRKISEYYRREATMFRQKADETAERVAAYGQLFGEESEWVSGARLLGEFYQQEARERERLAEQYRSPSDGLNPPTLSPREHRRTPK